MTTRSLFFVHIDLTELDREQTYNYTIAGIPRAVPYWTVHSRPDREDSDGDGVFDNQDTAPLKFGVLDPDGRLVVGALKIFAYTKDPMNDMVGVSGAFGHSFLAYTSYVRCNVDFWGIRISSGEPDYTYYHAADAEDRIDDGVRSSWHTIHFKPNEYDYVTIGTYGGSVKVKEKRGAFIDWEKNGDFGFSDGKSYAYVVDQASLMQYVTQEKLEIIKSNVQRFDNWTLTQNCSWFSCNRLPRKIA